MAPTRLDPMESTLRGVRLTVLTQSVQHKVLCDRRPSIDSFASLCRMKASSPNLELLAVQNYAAPWLLRRMSYFDLTYGRS